MIAIFVLRWLPDVPYWPRAEVDLGLKGVPWLAFVLMASSIPLIYLFSALNFDFESLWEIGLAFIPAIAGIAVLIRHISGMSARLKAEQAETIDLKKKDLRIKP